MSETIAQHLEKKGERKGRQEGRKEGRQEGRQEGQLQALQDILCRLLRQRFGRLPAAVRQQIKALTDAKRLQAALDQVLRLQSLDDLQL